MLLDKSNKQFGMSSRERKNGLQQFMWKETTRVNKGSMSGPKSPYYIDRLGLRAEVDG